MKIRRLTTLAVLLSLALALNLAEALLSPPLPLPGVRFGLTNIVILLVLIRFRFRDALFVTLVRVLLTSLITGTIYGMGSLMSFSGAICSLIVMALLLRLRRLSYVTVSLFGSFTHVLAQIIVAMCYLQTSLIIFYLPFLGLISLLSGALVGIIVRLIIRHDVFLRSSSTMIKGNKKAVDDGSFDPSGSFSPR